MTEHIGFWMFLSVMWSTGTALLGYVLYLRHKAPQGEYQKLIADLRSEMNALAATIGLARKQQAPRFGPPPVGPQM
jgi:hypothetical protein